MRALAKPLFICVSACSACGAVSHDICLRTKTSGPLAHTHKHEHGHFVARINLFRFADLNGVPCTNLDHFQPDQSLLRDWLFHCSD